MRRLLAVVCVTVAIGVGALTAHVWRINVRSVRVDQKRAEQLIELAECLDEAGLAHPVVESDRYAELGSAEARSAFRRADGGVSFGDHGSTFGGSFNGDRADGTVIVPRNERDAAALADDPHVNAAGGLAVYWLGDTDDGDLRLVRSCAR